MGIIKLSQPILDDNDSEIAKIEYDFDKLTGEDLIKAINEYNRGSFDPVPMMQSNFRQRLFAQCTGVSAGEIAGLPLADGNAMANAVFAYFNADQVSDDDEADIFGEIDSEAIPESGTSGKFIFRHPIHNESGTLSEVEYDFGIIRTGQEMNLKKQYQKWKQVHREVSVMPEYELEYQLRFFCLSSGIQMADLKSISAFDAYNIGVLVMSFFAG